MITAITNLSTILTGDLDNPSLSGGTILMEDSLIKAVGAVGDDDLARCDVIIDAADAVAAPGLIDSHVHLTFGDYTPRQKTVGFLESYVHGGVTTAISASEVHTPGRPKDVDGVKALAVAARKSSERLRPGGLRLLGGSLILEPGLSEADFDELAGKGVWLAKAGFGAFADPADYAPYIAMAKHHGMTTTMHTGGASIPDSSGIWASHLLTCQPDVSFHVNGGPVAMPDDDYPKVVSESDMALQVCTAGNLRTTLRVGELLRQTDQLHRLLIATDTPTGSGVMPLGMLYTISHLASLSNLPPEIAVAAATGNNARVYGLNCGIIAPGRDADVIVLDACAGGSRNDALSALRNGDIPAVAAAITDGQPRFVGQSRNTPAPMKPVRVAHNAVKKDFGGAS